MKKFSIFFGDKESNREQKTIKNFANERFASSSSLKAAGAWPQNPQMPKVGSGTISSLHTQEEWQAPQRAEGLQARLVTKGSRPGERDAPAVGAWWASIGTPADPRIQTQGTLRAPQRGPAPHRAEPLCLGLRALCIHTQEEHKKISDGMLVGRKKNTEGSAARKEGWR